MVDDETIVRVAKASRINISEKDFDSLRSDFNEILKIFEVIDDADVSSLDDNFVSLTPIEISKKFREDISVEKNLKDSSVKLSPHKKDGFFKGPRCFD